MGRQYSNNIPPRWRAALALTAGLAVASAAIVAVPGAASAAVPSTKAPLLERNADVVTSDPLPTVQIDSGYVWAQATVGTTVYAGGSFSNARGPLAAPGTNLTPRSNILAYDITTGNLLPFAPQVNGVIKAVTASPDGSRLYIGGTFTQVNGKDRYNFAAFDTKTGELVPGFAPVVGGTGVYAIAATADKVYVGGLFTQGNGVARTNLAAFAAADGALQAWAPTTDRQVDTMVIEPGGPRVIVGGRFDSANGVRQRGLVALDPISGRTDATWVAPKTVQNSTPMSVNKEGFSGIFGLTTDANTVYGTGWSMGDKPENRGNLEGAFAAEAGSGAIRWVADCHGDSYGVYSTGKTVYTTSHTHTCESNNMFPEQGPRTWRYFSAFTAEAQGTLAKSQFLSGTYSDWSGTPAPSAYAVTPDFTVGTATGMGQAGLSITGAGDFISVAGEFGSVNNRQYTGIVRFSTKPAGGAKQGPYRMAGGSSDRLWAGPKVSTDVPVRAAIETNWDRDNRDLTYQLLRSDKTEPVAQTVATSMWWDKGTVTLDDPSAIAGATYTYTVRAVDADGNAALSEPTTVTATSVDTSAYWNIVRRDGAEAHFPLANAKTDYISKANLVFGTGVTATSTTGGAVPGLTPAASVFSGTVMTDGSSSQSFVSASTPVRGDDNFSAEVWFKTTTTSGGKIFSYGTSKTSTPSKTSDRILYMQDNGALRYWVRPGSENFSFATPKAYNDGTWHHAVVTTDLSGTVIYVDGQVAAKSATITTAKKGFDGYWRLGWDGNPTDWPVKPTSSSFKGNLDEFAAYPSALSPAQVARHYAVAKGAKAPVVNVGLPGWTQGKPDVFFVSSATPDTGATIVSTSWDFGDGTTASGGATQNHRYAVSGDYTVTFTATDSRGLTTVKTFTITITVPNALPTAAFTPSVSELTASVDASASADTDGTIASYAWNWGDGSAAGEGATAIHTYATAGTYTITLTVTDDDGGQSTTTSEVTVAPKPSLAQDAFERTGTSGWGTAEIGGAWTVAGGPASAASVAGGKGVLSLAAGSTRNLMLNSASAKNVTMSMDFSLDAAPSTGVAYAGLIARSSSPTSEYRVRARMDDKGAVWIYTQRGDTVLSTYQVPGIVRAAGDAFTLKVDVSGDASTKISAKLWRQGTPEPATWQTSVTDANGINAAGAVGVHGSRAGSATTVGVISVDGFRVIDNG